MTYKELAGSKVIVEIDDVHHANAIVAELHGMHKELRVFRLAKMLAALREYYVSIGREVERQNAAAP